MSLPTTSPTPAMPSPVHLMSTLATGSRDSVSSALSHQESNTVRRLTIASIICFLFFLIELAGGIFSSSLAIFSDSFHLLSDLLGFLISLGAIYISRKKATSRYSFGFHRAEILGALVSVLLIWVVTGMLVWEAIDRIRNPRPIDTDIMLAVALIGLGVNLILVFALGHGHGHGHDHHNHQHSHSTSAQDSATHLGGDIESRVGSNQSLLDHASEVENYENNHNHDNSHEVHLHSQDHAHGHHHHGHGMNINLRAAIIHVIGDIVSSVGVVVAALILKFTGWLIVDPICTFFFSIIVLYTTYQLIKDSIFVLMESTPFHIDPAVVKDDLSRIPHVGSVHDLHIWTLTLGKPSLAVHLSVGDELSIDSYSLVLRTAQDLLCEKYGVHHTTIQVEPVSHNVFSHCQSSICNGGVCGGTSQTMLSISTQENAPILD